MKKLVFLAAFIISSPVFAGGPLEDCAEYAEYGLPSNDGTLLCRMGYLTAHDDAFLTPIWVAERMTIEKVFGETARKDNFKADPDLPEGKRAELSDYKGSGYDRGHMAPAASMKWHPTAMDESFFLSNMVPQNGPNNQQIWASLEAYVRDLVIARGEIIIYTGPIYDNDEANATIGKNNVGVPDRLYKVIYDPKRKEAIAFLLPNQPISTKFLPNYIVPVREIESITGLNFLSNLPRKEQNRIEKAKAEMWDRR
ncbi:MAG: DNA/RNA non-specific endonuclease [Azoarcus sp.]|nr:DNA/RNA non-specific endonuclease [Azoarcus sp.]